MLRGVVVLVTCIHPGHVGTDIGWLGDKDDKHVAAPEDLYDAAVRLGELVVLASLPFHGADDA